MSLKAVIFDVDGVLVQSMEKHYEAYQRVFAEIDVTIDAADVYRNEGRRSREVIESMAEERGLDLPPERLDQMNRRKQEIFFSFGPLPLYPGVRELVAWLKEKGLKIAAVTGTNKTNVRNHLQEFAQQFDEIVTADDVHRTKPDPEPYLAALEKLDVEPELAVVVENASLGIRSAKAAGIRVVAVTSTNPPDVLSEADRIVGDIRDVRGYVEGFL